MMSPAAARIGTGDAGLDSAISPERISHNAAEPTR